MNWKEYIVLTVITILILITIIISISGCESTGFEKRATLVPDSVGVSFSQARYREEDAAYRGFTINAQWNLK